MEVCGCATIQIVFLSNFHLVNMEVEVVDRGDLLKKPAGTPRMRALDMPLIIAFR